MSIVNEISFVLSVLVAIPVVILCILVTIAYGRVAWRPPFGSANDTAWIAHGIFAGFIWSAANVGFWSIKWLALMVHANETAMWVNINGGLIDPAFKLGIAWAAHCHLYAVWLRLPPDRRESFRGFLRGMVTRRR